MTVVDPTRVPRLLIVDEHVATLKILALSFRRRGYLCATATTADDAVDAVTTHAPDAAVVEWYFRAGHAADLPARLHARAAELRRRLVVMVLSVCDATDISSLRGHVDDYFVKPTPIAVIDRGIRERLWI